MSKLNKLVSNYPVVLTEQEVANLSSTLLPVVEACGGGGGGGITQYYGDGTYTEITGSHVITLTNETKQKINRTIPTKVSDLSDSANYQTVAGMDQYLTETEAQATYLTKSSADTLYAPLSTTADVEALKAASGDFSHYYTKNETYSKNEVYTKEDVYQKTETSSKSELENAFIGIVTDSELETAIGNVNIRIDTLQDTVDGKQNSLTYGYDENNAISSIDGTPLAGQGGTTYSAGQYINIDDNDTISVTGLLALDEYAQYEPVLIGDSNITATSSKVDSHTQWNLRINATPVTTDTTLKGENVVTAHTTQVSGEWAVGLVQSAYEAIDSVDGIATDVGTLKTASAGWNEVSAKLGTAQYATDSATFLTQNDLANYYQKTETSGATELSTEFAKYLTTAQYNTDSATFALKTDLNDLVSSAGVTTTDTDYVMTTTGWKVLTLPGGGMTQVIHDETLSGQGNANDNKLGVAWSALSSNTIDSAKSATYAEQYWDAEVGDYFTISGQIDLLYDYVDDKVDKPDTTQAALNDKYLIYSTLSGEGQPTGWVDMQTKVYSKTEADGTFVATADVGSGLYYSGSSPKLGVKLGTDLAFNATTSAIQINTNGTAYGAHAFVEGTNTTASGEGAHAEGADAGAFGQGAHAGGYGTHTTGIGNFIHGTFLNFASPDGTSVSNTPVFVGGTLNATSAQNYNDHGGYLQIMGNGTYTGGGQGNNSDAYILYRDGSISAAGKISANGMFAVDSAATLIGASRQTPENYGVNNSAIGTTWIGVGSNGMNQGFIKYTNSGNVGALDSNSMIQLNLKPSTNNFDSVQVQINGNSVGYLIPAVTSTTTAGLTNDGILHIIVES